MRKCKIILSKALANGREEMEQYAQRAEDQDSAKIIRHGRDPTKRTKIEKEH
jgi:hypothetical protein